MIPDAWRRGEVAVIGLGRSGLAAGRWLAAQGLAVTELRTPDPKATAEIMTLYQRVFKVEITLE